MCDGESVEDVGAVCEGVSVCEGMGMFVRSASGPGVVTGLGLWWGGVGCKAWVSGVGFVWLEAVCGRGWGELFTHSDTHIISPWFPHILSHIDHT